MSIDNLRKMESSMTDKIGNFELVLLNISAILGVGILALPRRAAENGGINGIISIAIAGLLVTAVSYVYAKLAVKFENQTIFEFSESLVGKYLTRIVALIFSMYFIITLALETRITSSSIKLFLLYNTPLEVIMITLLLISAITVNYGLITIARLCSNYSIATILSLLIILTLSLKYFNLEVMYSILSISFWKTLQASFELTTGYLGFAIILFVVPFLEKPKKIIKMSIASTLVVTLIYALTVLVSFGEFGITPNQYIMYPTATLSKGIFISGFADRIDLLFMTFWILAAYISITVRWFTASYSLSKIIPQKNYTVFTFLSLPLIYILSLIIQSEGQVEKVSSFLVYVAWFVFIPIVFILFILSFNRKVGAKNNEKI